MGGGAPSNLCMSFSNTNNINSRRQKNTLIEYLITKLCQIFSPKPMFWSIIHSFIFYSQSHFYKPSMKGTPGRKDGSLKLFCLQIILNVVLTLLLIYINYSSF